MKNLKKLISTSIVLIMIVALFSYTPLVRASQTVDGFVSEYNGTLIYNYGYAQCVALANQYNDEVIGCPFISANWASDWYNYFYDDPNEPNYYIRLDASQTPQKGDLAVWSDYGNYGFPHIALVVDPLSGNSISCFTQNPDPAHVETLTRTGLLGYVRPKIFVSNPPSGPPGSLAVSCSGTFYDNQDAIITWTSATNAAKYGLTVKNTGDGSTVFDDYVYGNQKDLGELVIGNYKADMAAYNLDGAMGPVSNMVYFSVVSAPTPTPIPTPMPTPTPTLTPTPVPSFIDISEHWGEDYINNLAALGVMSGYETESGVFEFKPDSQMKRQEFAKIVTVAFDVYDSAATTDYTDCPANAWFTPYVGSLANEELTTGMGDGTYGVNLNMTRQDTATMLSRAMVKYQKITLPNEAETATAVSTFSDVDGIADYAKSPVACFVMAGIINGYGIDNNKFEFRPTANITRGEISKIMIMSLEYVEPTLTPTP